MAEWLEKHFNKVLGSALSFLVFLVSVIGWFLKREMDKNDQRYNQQHQIILREISDRKEADKGIVEKNDVDHRTFRLMIESAVSYREFENVQKSLETIESDIKDILKNQN